MRVLIGLIITTILISLTGCSQTNKIEKGYAYARPVLSGVKPKVSVAEDGSIIQKSDGPGVQYFIYVATKDTTFLIVKNVLIKGQKYNATAEAIDTLPVVIQGKTGITEKSDTLFSTTNSHAWKINLGQLISPDDETPKPKHFNGEEVLIEFLSKGSLHYFPIAKINYLEPISLQ